MSENDSNAIQETALPSDLIDDIAIDSVDLKRWHEVFRAARLDASSTASRIRNHDDVRNVLSNDQGSALFEAVAVICALGTSTGIEVVSQLAEERAIIIPDLSGDSAVQDLAALLWVKARTDPQIRELLDVAQVQIVDQEPRRATFSLSGDPDAKGRAPIKAIPAIRRDIADWCARNSRSAYVDVSLLKRGTEFVFKIIHGNRKRRLTFIEGNAGGEKRETRDARLAAFDLVRLDGQDNLLAVATRSKTMVRAYARVFGRALFDDPEFYGDAVLVDLRRLQEGSKAIEDTKVLHAAGLVHARLRHLVWDRGSGSQMTIRSADCYRLIAKDDLPLHEGQIAEATIGLLFEGTRTREVRVHLKHPGRIDYPRDLNERGVETFLRQTGLRRLHLEPELEQDLWSLHAWHHPASTWRRVIAEQYESWIEAGLLEQQTGAGTEVVGLNIGRFAVKVGDSLDLGPEQVRGIDGDRLFLLGTHQDFGGHPVTFVLVARDPGARGDSLERRLPSLPGARTVLLTPSGRSLETSHVQIDLDWLDLNSLLPAAVKALGVEETTKAIWRVSRRVRLVVERGRAIYLDRVPLELKPGTQPFRMVELLAQAPERRLKRRELQERIAPDREEDAPRQWKRQFKKAVVETFEGRDLQIPEDLDRMIDSDRRGGPGYRLTVLAECP